MPLMGIATHGGIHLDTPAVATRILTLELHFTADFHHEIGASVAGEHVGNRLHSVAFGHGREIETCRGPLLVHYATGDAAAAEPHGIQRLRNGGGIGAALLS